ncbi:hypothetical protein [Synechococcus sp. UW105]|nr:hypothetical protein [Synechococcus sp. UW105]
MTAVQRNGAFPALRLNEHCIAAAKPAITCQALSSQRHQNNTEAAPQFR